MSDAYDFINFNELKKVLPDLEKFTGELPWVLFDFIDPVLYLGRVKDDDVIKGFYDRKHDIQIVDNPLEYMEYDFREWVNEYPEFEKLLL